MQWKVYGQGYIKPDGHEVTVPVWIDDKVDRIRIRPDRRRCDFTRPEIVLMLPDPPAANETP